MKTTTTLPPRLPQTFEGLARIMVPHAIVDEADYHNVSELVNRLAVLNRLTEGQQQYLDTLAQLIESYDQVHYSIEPLNYTPLQMLKSFLNDHKMTASDLGRLLGNRSLGSKILRGERQLSKTHIAKLADRFKVSPALFFGRK